MITGDALEFIPGESVGGNDLIDGGDGDGMGDTARGGEDVITGGPGDDLLFGDATAFNDQTMASEDIDDLADVWVVVNP